MKKKIMITGSTGFIGRALLSALRKTSFDVTACYRTPRPFVKKFKSPNISFVRLDLTRRNDFKKIKNRIDSVIHLASHVHRSDRDDSFEMHFNNNVCGTLNLLEFCRERKVKKLIYVSTKYVYGRPNRKNVDEKYPALPLGEFYNYGATKLICEQLCKRYAEKFGIKILLIRLSSVFGPDQEDNFLIPRLIEKVKNDNQVVLYGDGLNIMEYLFIDDCVGFLLKALRNNYQGLYNIGSGVPLRFKNIAKEIVRIFSDGKNFKLRFKPIVRTEPVENNFALNINKAKKEIGFRPRYSFEAGLKQIKLSEKNKLI